MGEKWRVEKPTHFREDESQVTAGGVAGKVEENGRKAADTV